MPQHYYEQLLVERGHLNHSWEEAIMIGCTLDDLDTDEIHKTVSDGVKEKRIPGRAIKEEPKDLLSRFNLILKKAVGHIKPNFLAH